MAEEQAGTSGEPARPESPIQQPRDKSVPARRVRKRSPRSVLQVSQLLLRAIAGHKGLTLTALKKELGSAGYEVRRKSRNPNGDPARPDPKGALLRVSGGAAAGCFRVWKVPKSKRKQRGATRSEEASRAGKRRTPRSPARTRNPQRPGATKQQQLHQQLQQCRVTRKAREAWGSLRANARRPGVKSSPQPRRSRAEKTRRAQPSKEVGRSRTRENKRKENKNKAGDEKEEEQQQPTPPENENLATGQAKMYDLRVTRSKTSTKSEGARTASKSP